MRAAYVDASALVKLFKPEPETEALWDALADWPVRVSSELLIVEARCTARRLGGGAILERAEAAVGGIDLLPYTPSIRDQASSTAFNPPLRALDAIHVATALSVRADLGVFFAYDADLCAAARSRRLPVRQPG